MTLYCPPSSGHASLRPNADVERSTLEKKVVRIVKLDDFLGTVEALLEDEGVGVDIAGADFDAEGHATLLPVELLVAGAVVAPIDDDRLICEFVEEVPW